MAKKTTPAVKRLPKEKAVLIPVAQVPANNMINPVAETFKMSQVSKAMRQLIKQRAEEENNAMKERFKRVLMDPAATEATIRASLTSTENSTIVAELIIKNGTILKTSLPNPLREVYKEAEREMKEILEREFNELFNARRHHTPAEIKALDKLYKKAQKPFNGKFREQQAQAA